MRDTLHWLPVRQRITFKICMLVRNCVNGSAPIYLGLQGICNSVSADVQGGPKSDTARTLHYTVREVSLIWPTLYIDHDFALLTTATWSCRAPTLTESVGAFFCVWPNRWNKLPPDIRKVFDKPEQFAQALKTFLFPNSTDKHF